VTFTRGVSLDCLTDEDETGCPETSLRNYRYTLHKNPATAKISNHNQFIISILVAVPGVTLPTKLKGAQFNILEDETH
jgi:hypothetical protein